MKILKAFLYQVGVLFLLSSFLIDMSYGSQKVVVTSSKAFIYADKDLTLPIGFVSFGRELTVGEVSRKGGDILPLIVSGKIAYIKVADISSLEGKKEKSLTRYYDADKDIIDYEAIKKIKKDLTKNNFLNTSYGFFEPGTEWHTLASTTGSLAEEKIKTIDLIFEHKDPKKRLSWGIGLSLYSLSQETVKTLTLGTEIPLYYNLFHYKRYAFDALLGLSISTGVQVRIFDQTGSYKGLHYGGRLGSRIRLPLTQNWGTFFTVAYRYLNMSSMDGIKRRDLDDYSIENLSGLHFTFGANYKL